MKTLIIVFILSTGLTICAQTKNISPKYLTQEQFEKKIDWQLTQIKEVPTAIQNLNIHNNNVQKTSANGGRIVRSIFAENIVNSKLLAINTEYAVYAQVLFVDSTVVTSSASGNNPIWQHAAGAIFDPTSKYWGSNGKPLLDKVDLYLVDTVYIGGVYKQVNFNVNDTLIIDCVWGAPNNSSLFSALAISSQSVSFRIPYLTNSTAHGHFSSIVDNAGAPVPATNYKRIKRVLSTRDTLKSANDGYFVIPTNINVGAGEIFMVSVVYKPGSVVPPLSVMYQYQGGSPQTQNSFRAYFYSDPSSTANYNFIDKKSYSGCFYHHQLGRYNKFTNSILNLCGYPDSESGWDIGFSVTYPNSSVGLDDFEKTGASLSQNYPNPFKGETTVKYTLINPAKNVSINIIDITGKEVYKTNADNQIGAHSIKLGSHLAAGVYYYTLNIDGATSSKKMIVQ